MKVYTARMHQKFQYRATWLPQVKMEVGQIGKFYDKKWVVEGHLSDLGIDITAASNQVEGGLEFTSQEGVSISTKLKGGSANVLANVADAAADVTIAFGKENSIVFKANDVTLHQLEKKMFLKDKILTLWEKGTWDKDYLIVSEVIEAASATIIVSGGANAKIELNASGDIGGKAFDLADAEAGFQVAKDNNIGVKVIAQSSITPLYNVLGIRKSLFSKADLVPRSVDDLFVEVAFGEED